MNKIHKLLLHVVIILLPIRTFATEPNATPEAVFKQLTSLVGSWEGKFPDGRTHSVSYKLTAGGTVLVETWTLSPSRESMTLYHMDGTDLMATHYCPQGNQPRLQFVQGSDPDKISFQFRDGTNLQNKEASHQYAFWIMLLGKNSFARSETYVKNNSTASEIATTSPDEAITYTRLSGTD